MEGSGARRNARAHKGQEPRETDVYGPTEAVQRETCAEQVFHYGASLGSKGEVFDTVTQLALARFTQRMLCAMASRAIFLEPYRATGGACLSDNHGCGWSPRWR
jgi:hypothetical protein